MEKDKIIQAIDKKAYDRDVFLHAKMEAERQVVSSVIDECTDSYGAFICTTYELEDKLMSRLSELQKPSEPKKIEGIPAPLMPLWEKIISLDDESINICTKNWLIASLIDGYNVGVSESKLSEPEAAQNCKPKQSNICSECGYPKTTHGNGIVERICTCGKPSENIGQHERLCLIIDKYLPAEGVGTEREKARMGLLTEITSLLPLPSFITPRNL